MDEKRLELMKENALYYFSNGLNCAESVFKAYLDSDDGTKDSELVALASGFGGGFDATKCNTCGALVGACLAVGMTKGRKNPLEHPTYEERRAQLDKQVNPVFRNMSNQFREEFKSTTCGEMCGMFEDTKSRRENCQKAVVKACDLVAEAVSN